MNTMPWLLYVFDQARDKCRVARTIAKVLEFRHSKLLVHQICKTALRYDPPRRFEIAHAHCMKDAFVRN